MPPDYDGLLDSDVRAFIAKTAESYPDGAVDLTIAEQRIFYDAMCQVFDQGRPAGVTVVERSADGVPVRVYFAGEPIQTVIYFHGGGFAVGGLDSHDDVCAEICATTGYRVISVEYRLSPEHHRSVTFVDAWTATDWIAREYVEQDQGAGFILAGDSAGGNLAAAVAHHARGRLDSILGQVLIYPNLGGDFNQGSYLEHAHAPMLTRDDVLYYSSLRSDGAEPSNDPWHSPLHDDDFAALPPTVIFTADCDPIRDDGRDYHACLTAAGVSVHWINEEGLVHGYLRARTSTVRGRASFERITVAIEALGQGVWPYD